MQIKPSIISFKNAFTPNFSYMATIPNNLCATNDPPVIIGMKLTIYFALVYICRQNTLLNPLYLSTIFTPSLRGLSPLSYAAKDHF